MIENGHKKAVKDSCVIVWDPNNYTLAAEKQLYGRNVYRKYGS